MRNLAVFLASVAMVGFWSSPVRGDEAEDTGAEVEASEQEAAQVEVSPAERRQAPKIEEIVVTATYRDTLLMDTPLPISTLDDFELEEKAIENIQSLYQSIPGLSYRTNSNTYNTISVRGLTPPGGGSSVMGVYLDDMPITDSTGGGIRQLAGAVFDLERVEVLKGPQGTLYGEGNMGGALRYITKKPDPSGWSLSLDTQYYLLKESDDPGMRAKASVNIPLMSERAALRVSVLSRNTAGFLDIPAPRGTDDVDDQKEFAVRASALFSLTDNLEIQPSWYHLKQEYGGPGNASRSFTSEFLTHLGMVNGGSDVQKYFNLPIRYSTPWFDFLSSSSYFKREIDFGEETTPRFADPLDAAILQLGSLNFLAQILGLPPFVPGFPAIPAAFLGLVDDAVIAAGGHGAFYADTRRFIQEFRLVSNTDSRWKWTAGVYFKDDEGKNGDRDNAHTIQATFTPLIEPFADEIFAFFDSDGSWRNTVDWAAYGEISYEISEHWEIMAGLRGERIEKELFSAASGKVAENTDRFISPKATLTWRPRDGLMLYGTYAQGFRPGVMNSGLISQLETLLATGTPEALQQAARLGSFVKVDGDEVVNFELGLKTTLFDGRLNLATSFYRMNWRETLISNRDENVVTGFGFNFITNEGRAHSHGVELELTALLTEELTFRLGGDWNESEIDSTATGQFASAVDGSPIIAQAGNTLANAPEYSLNMALDYRFPVLDRWEGNARVDYYTIDDSFNRVTNEKRTPGYHLTNLRLTFRDLDTGRWRVALFANNLFDKTILYESNEAGLRFGRPRTVGIEVGFDM